MRLFFYSYKYNKYKTIDYKHHGPGYSSINSDNNLNNIKKFYYTLFICYINTTIKIKIKLIVVYIDHLSFISK